MNHIYEDVEVSLRTRVPRWVDAVDSSAKNDIDYIMFMLDAFRDDPELLFNAVWYANSKQVAVMIAPLKVDGKKANEPLRIVTFLRDPDVL